MLSSSAVLSFAAVLAAPSAKISWQHLLLGEQHLLSEEQQVVSSAVLSQVAWHDVVAVTAW